VGAGEEDCVLIVGEMNVYEVQCSYEHEHPQRAYRANARYMVLTTGDIESAITRVKAEHPGCEVHQVIKRTHGVQVLVAD
jgi:hypothetical protein